jgi:hypothetical protein
VKPPPRAWLLAAATGLLLAQQPSDPMDLLVKARVLLAARAKRLPDYTCIQTIDRQYFKHPHPPPSCAQIAALDKDKPRDLQLQATDRLRLEIKVSQGEEIGTWAGASQFSSRSVFDLIGGGVYGTGTLGAFLVDIFQSGGVTYKYIGEEAAGPIKLAAYRYRVPVLSSHYQIKAGSHWFPTAFSGSFWIDPDSLDLRRVTVDANEIPPETGSCETATTIEYQKVPAGNGEFLLPLRSSTRMVMMDGTEARTTEVYSGCREYHGEATIRFDDAAAPGEVTAAAAPSDPLPPGLSFSLVLTSPIDTETAAAGDIATAKLRAPLRVAKEIVVPAGATVEGRIVQMRHWLAEPRHFTIWLVLEKLEWHGVVLPLYARLSQEPGLPRSDLVAALVFPTDQNRHIVPVGYQTNWVTVAPPAEEKR